MRTRSKLLLVALAATVTLLAAAGSATARSFSALDTALLNYISDNLTFSGPSGNRVICDVTLRASLHRSTAKVRGTLIGHINEGRANSCTTDAFGGSNPQARPLITHELPVHLVYESFEGTLPDIRSITFTAVNALFLIDVTEPFGGHVACLYTGNVPVRANGTSTLGTFRVRDLTVLANTALELRDELENAVFENCDREGSLIGRFIPQSEVRIRLI